MDDWQQRIDAVYAEPDLDDVERIARIDEVADIRGAHDARALFERAGVRDFAGREAEAEPLYRSALAVGLTGAARTQALIQLASTVRNLGRAEEALALLREAADVDDGAHADAISAFRALALVSVGEPVAATAAALRALAPHLTLYGRAVRHYADEL